MPRRALGPRLYLRRREGYDPVWSIRHGQKFISTHLPLDKKSEAETILYKYRHEAGWLPAFNIIPKPARENYPEMIHTIYFVSCDVAEFPIKIGYATDLRSRLSSIQTAMPFKVIVLAQMPGTKDEERDLKTVFAQSRLRGEWFRRSPDLMEYISEIESSQSELHQIGI